jgi:ABC-type maltose transport system permease subunit
MKNMINTVKTAVTNTAITVRNKAQSVASRGYAFSRRALAGNSGEGYIDTAIKILIAVVLGALLLFTLYNLFGDTVLPKLEESINDMFGFGGAIDQLG